MFVKVHVLYLAFVYVSKQLVFINSLLSLNWRNKRFPTDTMYSRQLYMQRQFFGDSSRANVHRIIDRVIRVDHAGELGADRIYAGQMAVLGKTDVGHVIQHMWNQEKEHLAKFEELITLHRVRPTVLYPIWNAAGYMLGAASALMGKEGAMACTVAVESVITDHYNSQLRELLALGGDDFKELIETIKKFRDDEINHHDTGLAYNAENTPGYGTVTEIIKTGCKIAIWLSERI